jgi:hypothetical protein
LVAEVAAAMVIVGHLAILLDQADLVEAVLADGVTDKHSLVLG